MPWTLYKYILKSILKLLFAATAVLLAVISFGATIKPLTDGIIPPSGLPLLIFYTMPTMLTFALPFGAAFASVLVFCRMSADNEILACSASGLSYRRVLLPVFVLGLTLTMTLFFLSNWVVPGFYHRVAMMLERDLTKMIVTQIHNGQTVEQLENSYLYADTADDTQTPPILPNTEVQPHKLIRLTGVAFTQLDKHGKAVREYTASSATVLLFHDEGSNYATMHLENVSGVEKQGFINSNHLDVQAIALPSPLKDNPRFLSWPQLKSLSVQPEKYDQIRIRKEKLAMAIASDQIMGDIAKRLRQGQNIELIGPLDEKYSITSPVVEADKKNLILWANANVPVQIEQQVHGLVERKIQAKKVTLDLESDDIAEEPRILLEPSDARVSDQRLTTHGTDHASLPAIRARWPETVLKPLLVEPLAQIMTRAEAVVASGGPQAKAVQTSIAELKYEKLRLGRRILAQLNERAASSVGCMLILLLGAIFGAKYRGGTPLVVYFFTFMLAAVEVVINSSGFNYAREPRIHVAPGLLVLWSGNLILMAIVFVSYMKISRN